MSYKKFTKDIGLLGLTQIIGVVGGIITLPIITKMLGVKDYGVWTQLVITVNLIAPIAVLGLPYTLVRFLAAEKDKQEIQDGFWSAALIIFSIAILIASGLIIFAKNLANFFECDVVLIKIMAVATIFEYLNAILLTTFRAFQETAKYCLFAIIQEVGETSLVILTIIFGFGLKGAILSFLSTRIFIFLIMSFLIVKKIGVKVPKFLRIKEYLSFGLPNVLSDLAYWVVQSSDRYMIGFFMGTLFVGYYAPAYTLGSCITFFALPLLFILPAILSKHYDENEIDKVKTYLKYCLKYFLAIAIPAAFGVSVLSKSLLTIFSRQEIAEKSYNLVPIIACGAVLFGCYTIFAQILALKKKTKISGTVWLLASILNFLLNILFIPLFGIMGAAITTFLAFLLIFSLILYYSFKEIEFEIDWKFIIKSILASAIMGFVLFAIHPIRLWQTLGSILLGSLIYLIIIVILKGFSKNEFIFFLKIFD